MPATCPLCQGTGYSNAHAVDDATLDAVVATFRAACTAMGAKITADGLVRSPTAAALLDKSESRLASMRSEGGGPSWFKRGRVYYSLRDLARWQMQQVDF